MYLLNTRTLRLEIFNDGDLPQYAILSHCWTDEEVTFQDVQYETAQDKHGFRKIEGLCKLALQNGHEYAWIDTCCIDKTSSADLSEAINSMWLWYKRAAVCYVYLEDFLEEALSGISKSRWFTRGWTLLELLAPSRVLFFDQEWRFLGDKRELALQISSITGIAKHYIDGSKSIFEASVAERMSWAARRYTTRAEDNAYCLLGIFDVNMPMLYGEGRKAFLRLQEEIIKQESDRTLFAWTRETGQEVTAGLLAESPYCFRNGVDKDALAQIPDAEFLLTRRGIEFYRAEEQSRKQTTILPAGARSRFYSEYQKSEVFSTHDNTLDKWPKTSENEDDEQSLPDSERIYPGTSRTSTSPNNVTNNDSGYGSKDSSNNKATSAQLNSDTCSIMTDGRPIEMPENTKEYLASLLADDLSDNLDHDNRDKIASLRSLLPVLLRHFSMLMDLRARSNLEKDATSFVRHRREMISDFVERAILYAPSRNDVPTSLERIQMLMFREHEDHPDSSSEHDDRLSQADAVAFADDTGGPLPVNVPEARIFLTSGVEYKWLLNNIRKSLSLETTGNTDTMVRNTLIQILENEPIVGTSRLQLKVFWSPLHFFDYQQYPDGEFDFARVIVISGDSGRTYATSCGDYAELLWPGCGMEVLRCLGQACQSTSGGFEAKIKTAMLIVTFDDAWTSIDILGEAVDVLEIAEVCIWVATAFRVLPGTQHAVVHTMPKLSNDTTHNTTHVAFEFELPEAPQEEDRHTCWHQLFRQAIVAKGYPVPLRLNNERGMELSMPMISVLSQAPWATTFGERVLLRGIQSALMLVNVVGVSMIWHLLVARDYLPYSEVIQEKGYAVQQKDLATLETGRHFVGWTPAVDVLTGSALADYSTARSDATDTVPGLFALSGISLSGGKFVTVSATFTRGRRDIPVIFENAMPYELLTKAASKMRVILYGSQDQRAWFVDGASALLHLSRAWMSSEYAGDDCRRALADFQYPVSNSTNDLESHRSALVQNRDLKLMIKRKETKTKIIKHRRADGTMDEDEQEETTVTWWKYEDLVLQLWHYVEKIDGHIELRKRSNFEAPAPHVKEMLQGKELLEGFEISDLLAGKNMVKPRTTFLWAGASEWLNFASKVGTINLFAESFGDLIVPSQRRITCPHFQNVPTGFDHLVIPFAVLRQTCEENLKEHGTQCIQLAHAVYWIESGDALDHCSCQLLPGMCKSVVSTFSAKPQDPKKRFSSILERCPHGAIIIGHERRRLVKSVSPSSSSVNPSSSVHSDSGIDVNTLSGSSAANLSSSSRQQPLSRTRRLLKNLHLAKSKGHGEE